MVEPIPRTMRPRATALLSRLKAKPDVITWDKLNKLNVPKDLVRNEERWKEVLGETSGTMATPKLSVRSSPQFQKILKSYEERGTPARWERY